MHLDEVLLALASPTPLVERHGVVVVLVLILVLAAVVLLALQARGLFERLAVPALDHFLVVAVRLVPVLGARLRRVVLRQELAPVNFT